MSARPIRNRHRFTPRAIALAVATCFPVVTFGNPLDPTVAAGGATFENHGNTLTVTNTPGTIIDWQSFSIGQSEVTRFIQQSAASQVLNRVTGGDPSQILGALQSNGQVFLINPNGIAFGAGARVDVAGFVASTLNISNADFLSGRMSFAAGTTAGSIRNDGALRAIDGGSVYLIAPTIENNGVIAAPDGSVVLAAGKTATLLDSNRPFVQVEVTAGGEAINVGQLVGSHVGIYAGTVRVGGAVDATRAVVGDGGRILFKASGDATVTADAIVSANGKAGGEVRVESGGTTLVEGSINARGNQGSGGTIQVLGRHVGLVRESFIDASGAASGGTVLIGGDYQGRGTTVFNAEATFVSAGSVIRADAIERGDGGRIIVWADDATRVHGSISARGGAVGGNGGFVETSGYNYLDVTRAVDASAPAGRAGTWLLDPNNVTVQASGSDTNVSAGPIFSTTNDGAIVTVTSILTALNNGTNVSITTSSAGTNAQAGDITIAAAINKTSGAAATLTLSAHNNILINAGITSTNGALNLVVTPNSDASGGGAVTVANSLALNLNGGTVTLAGAGNFTLGNSSALQSATLARTGTGAYVFGSSSVLSNATLATNILVNGTVLRTQGNLTLGAGSSVTLTNGGWLYFDSANASLLGTGSVVFGDASSTATNYLYYNNSTAGTALSIGAGVTVGGATSLQHGTIYTSSANTGIANAGTIVAGVAGRSVNVGTSYGSV
ncbi:MAG: filamentous hemagglutinin N-terminal domain-containing protein, partial [Burkholderiales bacterium]|nr:filamentous hemagglutinin N-terminal domain-containing protein [Burkholderiales bacterium]